MGAQELRRRGNDTPRDERPQRLEMVDHAAAHEVVVLAGLACVGQGQTRSARIEVADLPTNAETMPDLDVQSRSDLQHTRGG